MQRRINHLVGAALGVGVLLATAGCGSASAPEAEDWTIPKTDPTASITVLGEAVDEDIAPVVAAFEKAHPSISVKYENVPFDQLNSVLEARVSAKDGNPDVYWADMPRIAALAARGYTTDLTEQFTPYLDSWDEASVDGASADGKLHGVPISNSTQLLYYNKDLLDAAGVAYPSADPDSRITWEQIVNDARTVKASGAANPIVFGQVDRYYQLEALPVSLGGSPGATGEGNLTPDVTSDAWVESMEWYGSIFEEGLSPRGVAVEQLDQMFLDGDSAFYVQGPWFLPALNDSDVNWGAALHPYFEAGEPVTATGSWALALNPFSKSKEASAIFMKWMSVDDGAGYITHRTDAELPANIEGKATYYAKDVFKSDEGKKAAEIVGYETKNTAVNRLSTVGYVEFEEILNRAFADIRNGADARTALETAETELGTAWAPYK